MTRLAFLFIFILSFFNANAQQEVRFTNASQFFVDGTSTIHDWTIESNSVSGMIRVANGNELKIEGVTLSLPVESLKSGKSGMDRKINEALDSRRHAAISFSATDVVLNASGTGGVAKGQLTIAGNTQLMEVPFTLATEGGNWKFSGSVDFKMSQFSVDPPTAVMGTIRSGDDIKVRFELVTAKPQYARAN